MPRSEALDLLAIAAHPDDAEAACGGLLAKLAKRGYRVAVCDATRGELASNGSVELREREASEAGRVLGLSERVNLGLPDGGLRADDPEQLRAVVTMLRHRAPRLVVAPHHAARHPDHVQLAELVRRAQFWCGVPRHTPDVVAVPRPVLLRALDYHPMAPSFVVDIRDEFEAKMRALRCYVSQFERRPGATPTILNDPAYLVRIETNARTYGQLIGSPAGEPFVVDGALRVDDPVAALATTATEVSA
jgi:bacillithiol biosynthesis deacetylase BshB1